MQFRDVFKRVQKSIFSFTNACICPAIRRKIVSYGKFLSTQFSFRCERILRESKFKLARQTRYISSVIVRNEYFNRAFCRKNGYTYFYRTLYFLQFLFETVFSRTHSFRATVFWLYFFHCPTVKIYLAKTIFIKLGRTMEKSFSFKHKCSY